MAAEVVLGQLDTNSEALDSDDDSSHFLENLVVHSPLTGCYDIQGLRTKDGAVEDGH